MKALSLVSSTVLAAAISGSAQISALGQSVGGIFKIQPPLAQPFNVQVNAYYDTNGAPAGSFYIGNSDWNFSAGYQYMILGTNLTFFRDFQGNIISARGVCFGTLNNYYYFGSRTKVLATTCFDSMLENRAFTVAMADFSTGLPIVNYPGMTCHGWLSINN